MDKVDNIVVDFLTVERHLEDNPYGMHAYLWNYARIC
jgi:hypothetical protein